MADEEDTAKAQQFWPHIMRASGSPLKVFALIVLICNAVFAIAAAFSSEPMAFIYTIHMFLAIVASFVLIALWSPQSFYSPAELAELKKLERELGDTRVFPRAQPLIPTLVLVVGVAGYAAYHVHDQYATRVHTGCSAKLTACKDEAAKIKAAKEKNTTGKGE